MLNQPGDSEPVCRRQEPGLDRPGRRAVEPSTGSKASESGQQAIRDYLAGLGIWTRADASAAEPSRRRHHPDAGSGRRAGRRHGGRLRSALTSDGDRARRFRGSRRSSSARLYSRRLRPAPTTATGPAPLSDAVAPAFRPDRAPRFGEYTAATSAQVNGIAIPELMGKPRRWYLRSHRPLSAERSRSCHCASYATGHVGMAPI